jgi:hypothetical protein
MNFAKVVSEVPQLARGQVWCRSCGASLRLDSNRAMASGWPKCCGYTMTIDSPEEQASFRTKTGER